MASNDLDRLRAILEAVQPLDRDARQRYLDHACGKDEALRREIEDLLAPGFLSGELSAVVGRAAADVVDPLEHDVAGRAILHYRVEQRIGQGGMGVVYRAADTRLDRQVALKFLRGPTSPGLHEARAASALNHPSICTVYDVGEFEGRSFIAMEYLDGETLEQRIARSGRLSTMEALAFAIQIAEGLEAAHAKGLAHRDIKPGNVMVTATGRLKILDFGLAERVHLETPVSRETGPEPVLGTVYYMSPEQALGGPMDQRTDLFSIGVVLYQMLTATLPFDGPTPPRIVDRIVHHNPARLPDAELDRIVGRCLAKSPDARYESATALLHDLRRLHDRPARWTSRHWLTAGIAAAALLTVLVWASGRFDGKPANFAGNVSPLTGSAGEEDDASFSPDGSRVAYSWQPDGATAFGVHVKRVGSAERPLRLTGGETDDIEPTWSPDGSQIAFLRAYRDGSELRVVPAAGGDERLLLKSGSANRGLSWSPDGRTLAYVEPKGIHTYSIHDGARRALTAPPPGQDDSQPTYSPDGRWIGFVRTISSSDAREIFVVSASGGAASQRTRDGHWIQGFAWTKNSRGIVYASNARGLNRLYRVTLDAPGATQWIEAAGFGAYQPAISPDGTRLAYTTSYQNVNIWRLPGHQKLIASSQASHSPSYSSDAARIAFISNRTGSLEVWVAEADGSNARPITSIGGPHAGSPAWSPDGSTIAFDTSVRGGRSVDVFVVPSNGGTPRRVTDDVGVSRSPSWSADGRWIYYSSSRTGRRQVFRQLASGGPPEQMTFDQGYRPMESPDGRYLYFTKANDDYLWRLPLVTRVEERVPGLPTLRDKGFWTVTAQGVYWVGGPVSGLPSVLFRPFTADRTLEIGQMTGPLPVAVPGIAAGSGGAVLVAQQDHRVRSIMVLDGFR